MGDEQSTWLLINTACNKVYSFINANISAADIGVITFKKFADVSNKRLPGVLRALNYEKYNLSKTVRFSDENTQKPIEYEEIDYPASKPKERPKSYSRLIEIKEPPRKLFAYKNIEQIVPIGKLPSDVARCGSLRTDGIWYNIARLMDMKTLCKFSLTCKYFYYISIFPDNWLDILINYINREKITYPFDLDRISHPKLEFMQLQKYIRDYAMMA